MNKTEKILMLAPSFAFRGGITRVVLNYKIGGLFNENIQYFPTTIEGHKLIRILFTLRQLIVFSIKLISTKFLLIHVHTSSRVSFYRKSMFIYVAKLLRRKVVLHIHPSHFYYFMSNCTGIQKLWVYKVLNLCDSFIVLTKKISDKLKGRFPEKSIAILPNPVDLNNFKDSRSKKRQNNILLYLGTFFTEKGVYDLIKAAPLIIRELPNIKIVLCGAKGEKNLKKEIEKSNLESRIEVREWVDGISKKEMLFESTALILPSYSEGIPNVILEAMSSHLPIIATPVGGIPSILKDEENCLFFTPGDIDDLKSKVVRIFKDKALQASIAQSNYKKIEQYDVPLVIRQLNFIYKDILCPSQG